MSQKDRAVIEGELDIMIRATQDLGFEIPQPVQNDGHNLRIQTKRFTFFHLERKGGNGGC